MTTPAGLEVEALQAALGGVEATMWGYGVVGAHLDGQDADRAEDIFEAYRALRDRLRQLIRDRGVLPEAGRAAYALPFPVRDARSARRLAIRLETGSAALFAELVAAAAGEHLRSFGAGQLRRAATRARDWGQTPVAFPGLPERADAGD